jgi:hypothetical protein
MGYDKLNKIIGWVVFAIATTVYLMTIEDTASLWDCGEYITAAYKLEVGHPPGAPLFMILGRLFSFFAAPEGVAVWINALSALSSSFTILFMFWSLTMLLKKIALNRTKSLSRGDQIAIFSGAAIGSLAYTFSDSFWFSAVEGEVYAMASLFTAIIFWAILKWDEEMAEVQNGQLSLTANPNRWLLLILFLLGLAIGVHLLGILVVPAIGYMIYFRVKPEVNVKGILICGIISVFTLGFIQEGIIPGSVSMASSFEVAFVNSFGLPFFTGTIFFFLLLIGLCIIGVYYAQKLQKTILYNAMMGLIFLLIGYGSFAVIVIRSNANTPLDENDPENLVTLHSYLKREQYGSAPILYGNYWNSLRNGEEMTAEGPQLLSREGWKDLSAYYLRRYVVIENDTEVKAFTKKTDAEKWINENGGAYTIEEKYYESNASIRKQAVATYSQGTFFPRMHSEGNALHQQGYENWSGYDANEDKGTEIGRDGKRLPTFGENLTYFFRYQVNWMYIRYFMWNFSGRQNDIQGHGDNMRGNWISGINFIDEARLGSQEFAPHYTTNNASHNKFYMLPLILALVGLIFHIYRAPKDAFVLFLAFLFTGIAILVYLNQKPFEPRERDYAYAGSFYFFAMWIGIGVYAIYDFVFNKIKNANTSAIIATALGAIVPILMGAQGWDDHDRSGKTSARDLAYNYLQSCEKNGIIFTNGDNDTFPLWYLQEVEGIRTDVRVCNLSLMGTDWYTNQMKMRAYESDPLPIKFREDQILMYAGNTDQIYFLSLIELLSMNASDEIIKKVVDMRVKGNKTEAKQALMYFNSKIGAIVSKISTTEPNAVKGISYLINTDDRNLSESVLKKYYGTIALFKGVQNGSVKFEEGAANELQTLLEQFENPWSSVDFKEAMAFVRDDNNMVFNEGNRFSFFPSSRFALKVFKQNALKAGVISKNEVAACPEKIVFEFNSERDRYLARDEVMMMDIVANNDWKRGIYFSSSRGSSFSIALLSAGYVKQVGMAYELSPIKEEPIFFNLSKMKKNLLKTYEYGAMNNPNVLTDYYARRHTQQYRVNFLLLAEQLLNKGDKKGASELLDKSLELMPLENVLDFGEVNQIDPMNSLKINSAHTNFMYQGQDVKAKTSGCLHEYVQLYFMAGKKEKATSLGMKLADNYETIFNYFEHSDAIYTGNPENAEDLYAALDGCFKMYVIANDSEYGGKNGKLAKRLYKLINHVYQGVMPRVYNELQQEASDAGESASSIDGGTYFMTMISGLQVNLGAMGEHYGFLKSSGNQAPNNSEPDAMDLENLIKEDTTSDTIR